MMIIKESLDSSLMSVSAACTSSFSGDLISSWLCDGHFIVFLASRPRILSFYLSIFLFISNSPISRVVKPPARNFLCASLGRVVGIVIQESQPGG